MAGAQTDMTTLGTIPSFVYDSSLVNQHAFVPTISGSSLGVPPVNAIAGETPTPGNTAPVDYAANKQGQPPTRQPILWLVVLVVIGVLLIGHAAHLTVRGT